MMQSTRVKRTIIPPGESGGGKDSQRPIIGNLVRTPPDLPPAGRGDGRRHSPLASKHTPRASAMAIDEGRPTLVPLIPLAAMADSTLFHRALHLWNAEHISATVWDELTVPQQDEVRAIMRELQRGRCR